MKKNTFNSKLLITTALAGASFLGYGRNSYATSLYDACSNSGGTTYLCNTSSITTQDFTDKNNAAITTASGFSVNTTSGNAITVTGDGALSFTDSNAVTITSDTGIGLSMVSNLSNTGTAGSITINSNSNITSYKTGIDAQNSGIGSINIDFDGTIDSTGTYSYRGIYALNKVATTQDITINTGSNSSVSGYYGIYAKNNADNGNISINVQGDVSGYSWGLAVKNYSETGGSINITTASTSNISISGTGYGIQTFNNGTGSTSAYLNGNITSTLSNASQFVNGVYADDLIVNQGSTSNIISGTNGITANNTGLGNTEVTINGTINAVSSAVSISALNPYSTGISLVTGEGSYIKSVSSLSSGFVNAIYTKNLSTTDDTNITINGDVTAVRDLAIKAFNADAATKTNLIINGGTSGVTIQSGNNRAIYGKYGTVMDITINGGTSGVTIKGGAGTAIALGSSNDTIEINGNVNIIGNVTGGAGTDTLNIGTATINTGTSSFSGFEVANITGQLSINAGSTVSIGSTSAISVSGALQIGISSDSLYGKLISSSGINLTGGLITIDASSLSSITSDTTIYNVFSGGSVTGITAGLLTDNNDDYTFTSIVNGSSIDILVHFLSAPAGCVLTSGTSYLCSGTVTVAQEIDVDNAIVSTAAGFSANVASGNAITVTGEGDLSFTDENASSITASAGKGVYIKTTGGSSEIEGSITIETNSTINSSAQGIHTSNNSNGGNTFITANGTVTSTTNHGIHAYGEYYSANITITTGTLSDITGNNTGILALNTGDNGGRVNITASGEVTGIAEDGIYAKSNDGSVTIVTDANSNVTGADQGIYASTNGSYSTIIVNGDVTGLSQSGIKVKHGNYASAVNITTGIESNVIGFTDGINVEDNHYYESGVTIAANGTVTGTNNRGINVYNTNSSYDSFINVTTGSLSNISGNTDGIRTSNKNAGETSIAINGIVTGETGNGVYAYNDASASDITINTGSISSITGDTAGIKAINDGMGAITITAYGDVTGTKTFGSNGIYAKNASISTDITINTGSNSAIEGTNGIKAINNGTGSTDITVSGDVTGAKSAAISARVESTGGDLAVTTGVSSNISGYSYGISVTNNGTGTTTITANGTVSSSHFPGYGISAVIGGATSSGIIINTGSDSNIIGLSKGIKATNNSTGSISITAGGIVTAANGTGIHATNNSPTISSDITINTDSTSIVTGGGDGISANNNDGIGYISITANGTVIGTSGAGIHSFSTASSDGSMTIEAEDSSDISGGEYGIHVANLGEGSIDITANGTVTGTTESGIYAHNGSPSANITINTGSLSDITGYLSGIKTINNGTGSTSITANGSVTGTTEDGIYVTNSSTAADITINTGSTSNITSNESGIFAHNNGTGETSIAVNGSITSTLGAGIYANNEYDATNLSITTGVGSSIQVTSAASESDNYNAGIFARNLGTGNTEVTVNGDVTSNEGGILVFAGGYNTTINVGSLSHVSGGLFGIGALLGGSGINSINIDGDVSGGVLAYTFHSSGVVNITTGADSYITNTNTGTYYFGGLFVSGISGTSGAINVTLSGDINTYADAVNIISSSDAPINLTINGGTTQSTAASAIKITSGETTPVEVTLDGADNSVTLISNSGTAIDLGIADNILNISGTVNIDGDVIAAGENDTVNFGTTTITMSSGSIFSGFETLKVRGIATINTASTITIGSGALNIKVDSAEDYGQLIGTSGITFGDGGTITIDASSIGVIANRTTLTSVFSGGTVTGLTAGLLTDNSDEYQFTSVIYEDRIDILVEDEGAKPPLAPSGATSNSSAVGSTLDAITDASAGDEALQTIISTISNFSTDAQKDAALKTLAPDVSGSTAQASIAVNEISVGTIEAHIETARNDVATGIATGDNANNKAIWGQAFGKNIKQDFRQDVAGYDAGVGGFILGADTALGSDARVGAAFSYARTDAESGSSQTIIDTKQLSIYSTYSIGKIYLEGIGSGAINSTSGTRTLFDGSIASSSYDSNQFSAKGTVGYRANIGAWDVTPFTSLQYSFLDQPDYTETGSSANLHVTSNDLETIKTGLGIKIAQSFTSNGYSYSPHVSAAWYYDFINDTLINDSNFTSAPGITFTSRGATPAENSFKLGAGLDVLSAESLTISLDYNLEAREDYRAHTGQLTSRLEF